jgi:glycosyltransferase involved in cell wall biosynthesis
LCGPGWDGETKRQNEAPAELYAVVRFPGQYAGAKVDFVSLVAEMQEPLKVIYLAGTLDIGGAEMQIAQSAIRLNRQQFSPLVCCQTREGVLSTELRAAGIPVTSFGFQGTGPRYSPLAPLRMIKITLSLAHYFRQVRPNIVHCYLFWPSVLGCIAARLAGVPLVVSSRRVLGLFKDGKPHYQWLENFANRFTDLVLVNSQAVRRDVLCRERVDPRKIRLIYNGVDVERFVTAPEAGLQVRAEFGIPAAAPLVGIIANLNPYKGHRDFLQAAALVAAEFPRTHFLLVGRDDGIGAELRRLAGELGLSRRVFFTGPRQDIPPVLAALDVQVLASHQEAFSNAILEGMAAGKPLVVTDVGGNAEAVVDGQTGFVVPPHDPPALAGAILPLLRDGELRRRMGQAGRRRAKDFFDLDKMVETLQALYLEHLAVKTGLNARSV